MLMWLGPDIFSGNHFIEHRYHTPAGLMALALRGRPTPANQRKGKRPKAKCPTGKMTRRDVIFKLKFGIAEGEPVAERSKRVGQISVRLFRLENKPTHYKSNPHSDRDHQK